jgi:predicted nucleotidyltransferase
LVSSEIRSIVQRFREELTRRGYRIEKIVLYGSYASEKQHADSDIDLAVISPDFGKDRFEEGVLLRSIAAGIDPRIEPIPFSPANFESRDWVPLVFEIKEKGIIVS